MPERAVEPPGDRDEIRRRPVGQQHRELVASDPGEPVAAAQLLPRRVSGRAAPSYESDEPQAPHAPGALIGEIAVLRDGVRTASVRAENACRLARLSKAALARMEKDDPQLATLIQRLIITQLADKLANTTRIVDVGLH